MYQEVGSVDDVTLSMLQEWADGAEWTEWRDERHYDTWYVGPERVIEILPIFRHGLIQQFFLKIPAKGYVHKHVDKRKGQSYHIPITSNPYAVMHVYTDQGEVRQHLEPGKIYSVDRSIPHGSTNSGDTDRLHLIVEVLDADT